MVPFSAINQQGVSAHPDPREVSAGLMDEE